MDDVERDGGWTVTRRASVRSDRVRSGLEKVRCAGPRDVARGSALEPRWSTEAGGGRFGPVGLERDRCFVLKARPQPPRSKALGIDAPGRSSRGPAAFRSGLTLVCLLLAPLCATAQGTKADYERAEGLQKQFANKVRKASIKPHWFANDTRFWYRNDLADDAREFILVDALAGTRQPAFDHALVARQMGEDTEATRLPVEELHFSNDGRVLTLIGNSKQWRLDLENGNAEFGISIGEKTEWNRGYGTDALNAICDFGFGALRLERIELNVFEDNARAIRSYEKAGFRHEGRLRRAQFGEGRHFDVLRMALLRDEWLALDRPTGWQLTFPNG